MCILVVISASSEEFPFICFHNREEKCSRPTAPVEKRDGIISGMDLEAGGTWIGFNAATHNFVALTNWRTWIGPPQNLVSRGLLVSRLLEGKHPSEVLRDNYNGFNALQTCLDGNKASGWMAGCGGGPDVSYMCCQPNYLSGEFEKKIEGIAKGTVHCVSNAGLNDFTWPKVADTKSKVEMLLRSPTFGKAGVLALRDQLCDIFSRTVRYPESDLPDLGFSDYVAKGERWKEVVCQQGPFVISSDWDYGTLGQTCVIASASSRSTFYFYRSTREILRGEPAADWKCFQIPWSSSCENVPTNMSRL